jgi:hypothetical protein
MHNDNNGVAVEVVADDDDVDDLSLLLLLMMAATTMTMMTMLLFVDDKDHTIAMPTIDHLFPNRVDGGEPPVEETTVQLVTLSIRQLVPV